MTLADDEVRSADVPERIQMRELELGPRPPQVLPKPRSLPPDSPRQPDSLTQPAPSCNALLRNGPSSMQEASDPCSAFATEAQWIFAQLCASENSNLLESRLLFEGNASFPLPFSARRLPPAPPWTHGVLSCLKPLCPLPPPPPLQLLPQQAGRTTTDSTPRNRPRAASWTSATAPKSASRSARRADTH